MQSASRCGKLISRIYSVILQFRSLLYSTEVSMFSISRKELIDALKWCQKRSPLGTLVFAMNGKWGVPNQNEENIVFNFLRYWTMAKGAVMIQGRKRLEEIEIPVPDLEKSKVVSIKTELINLLLSMPERFKKAERFEELASFSRDMKSLFIWNKSMDDVWIGYIITAFDGLEDLESAEREFIGHEDSEVIASMYANCLLKRCNIQKAAEVLEPFRDSTDEDIQKRFDLLRRLQAVKGIS